MLPEYPNTFYLFPVLITKLFLLFPKCHERKRMNWIDGVNRT